MIFWKEKNTCQHSNTAAAAAREGDTFEGNRQDLLAWQRGLKHSLSLGTQDNIWKKLIHWDARGREG